MLKRIVFFFYHGNDIAIWSKHKQNILIAKETRINANSSKFYVTLIKIQHLKEFSSIINQATYRFQIWIEISTLFRIHTPDLRKLGQKENSTFLFNCEYNRQFQKSGFRARKLKSVT